MKKQFIILFIAFYLNSSNAQNITDALLYSNNNTSGTARFRAMSGAFGALGGDFSSLNVNPAGSGIFLNNQLSISLSSFIVNTNSNYFSSKTSSNDTNFDINQAGFIFVFENNIEDWSKFVIAANYENNNLNNSVFTYGTNPNNSVANYFLSYANPGLYNSNIAVSTLESSYYEDLDIREQQAFLGYQGYIINVDPSNPNNDTYISNVPAGDYYQENYMESNGYNGKLSLNFATEFKKRFYFGINLNSHFTDYTKTTTFYEENDNSQTTGLKRLVFENSQNTYGNGLSFQLGAIAKLNSSFRVGLSYESPTWYLLNDKKLQLLKTAGYNYGNPANPNITEQVVDSDYLLLYPTYKIQTPSKWTGSLAYVFGKRGLISVDYSLKDYSNTRFKPNDSYFRPINTTIDSQLNLVNEFRIGGEYRIKEWSLRAGYSYEESPYKNKKVIGDTTGFSSGFGYNFGSIKLDMAYAYSQRKSQQGFFSQGFTDGPNLTTKNNTISLTLLFEL
jgi:hypothetical protein